MNKEYAEQVAARIIEQLEQGTAPWQKPWQPGELTLPYNASTGNPYKGMNSIWLSMQGYSDPRWLTYNQAANEGAQVRRGSKGSRIMYWKFEDERQARDAQGKPVRDAEGKPVKERVRLEHPRAFFATVFNAEQIDGLPPLVPKPAMPEPERIARAEMILTNSQAVIQHVAGDRAYYSPSNDSITLPLRSQFPTTDSYYATALHELGHWTGHPSRLDRDLVHPFGSEGYAREELRAEIASLMLGQRLDVGHDPSQHAAYVGSWVKALKEDPREIFRAAADAEKISTFVMAFEHEQVQERVQMQTQQEPAQESVQEQQPQAQAFEQPTPQPVPVQGQEPEQDEENQGSGQEREATEDSEASQDQALAPVAEATPEGGSRIAGAAVRTTGIMAAMAVPGMEAAAGLALAPSMSRPRAPSPLPTAAVPTLDVGAGAPVPILAGQGQPLAAGDGTAVLVEHGADHYQHNPENTRSYFVTTQDDQGQETTVWGVDLERAVNESGAVVGDRIHVENVGFKDVTVNVPIKNEAGEVVDFDTKDTRRNTWEIEVVERARENGAEVTQAAEPVTATVDDPVQHDPVPEHVDPERTYLAVPYQEKDEAKRVARESGFRLQWDKDAKAWFAPQGADLSGMGKWQLDSPRVIHREVPESAQVQFARALKDAGLIVDGEPIMDGELYRVPVEGDKAGATSGAYAGHLEGFTPGGYIQNYKTGERINWKADGRTPEVSAEERARLAAEAAGRKQRRDMEHQAKYEATASAAAVLWGDAPAATTDNPYCKEKGINDPGALGLRVVPQVVSEAAAAHGIQIAKTAKEAKAMREADPQARVFKAGDLLIPGYDDQGKLWTLQSVNPSFKSLMKGGRKAGLFTVAGTNPQGRALAEIVGDGPVMVAEGYATADTVASLSGQPVVVAFDSGNLDAVAGTLRGHFPDSLMLIAADNDHRAHLTMGRNGQPLPNVGLEKAKDVAEKYGAGVAAPTFQAEEKASDWNDLRAERGEDAARKELGQQMAVAKRDAAVAAERLVTLARERDREARNDPTTSLDDAQVAADRGRAAGLIVSAAEQNSHIQAGAADGMLGTKGAKTAGAAAKAGIDRKHESLRNTVKTERVEVLSPARDKADHEKAQAEAAKKAERERQRSRSRARGMDAGL